MNRSIIFDADNDDEIDSMGGHFIILHTPDLAQYLEVVKIMNFGQQGNLGRYVSITCLHTFACSQSTLENMYVYKFMYMYMYIYILRVSLIVTNLNFT